MDTRPPIRQELCEGQHRTGHPSLAYEGMTEDELDRHTLSFWGSSDK